MGTTAYDQTPPPRRAPRYSDPAIQAYMQQVVDRLGPTVPVTVAGVTAYVPRHFIAVHGDVRADLATLAATHHWKTTA